MTAAAEVMLTDYLKGRVCFNCNLPSTKMSKCGSCSQVRCQGIDGAPSSSSVLVPRMVVYMCAGTATFVGPASLERSISCDLPCTRISCASAH